MVCFLVAALCLVVVFCLVVVCCFVVVFCLFVVCCFVVVFCLFVVCCFVVCRRPKFSAQEFGAEGSARGSEQLCAAAAAPVAEEAPAEALSAPWAARPLAQLASYLLDFAHVCNQNKDDP